MHWLHRPHFWCCGLVKELVSYFYYTSMYLLQQKMFRWKESTTLHINLLKICSLVLKNVTLFHKVRSYRAANFNFTLNVWKLGGWGLCITNVSEFMLSVILSPLKVSREKKGEYLSRQNWVFYSEFQHLNGLISQFTAPAWIHHNPSKSIRYMTCIFDVTKLKVTKKQPSWQIGKFPLLRNMGFAKI